MEIYYYSIFYGVSVWVEVLQTYYSFFSAPCGTKSAISSADNYSSGKPWKSSGMSYQFFVMQNHIFLLFSLGTLWYFLGVRSNLCRLICRLFDICLANFIFVPADYSSIWILWWVLKKVSFQHNTFIYRS